MSFYRPRSVTVVGIIVSLICALGWPAYGLIYSKLLFIMMQFSDPRYLSFSDDRAFWSGMFLLLVLCLGIFFFIQKYLFFYAGENLTFDIRNLLYKGIIYKDISWFDSKDRAPGVLSNILSEDISILNGMTTEHLGILIEAYGGLVLGCIIALCYTWKMGLVTMAFAPFISLGGVMMSRLAWKVKPGKSMSAPENKDMR
jgi:ABC-type multidrug transport system fused ATPase/permease subunit